MPSSVHFIIVVTYLKLFLFGDYNLNWENMIRKSC